MTTDPEAQGWTVSVAFKKTPEHDNTVGGYRKTLVRQLVSQMLNMRLREIARRPNAPFLGAQAGEQRPRARARVVRNRSRGARRADHRRLVGADARGASHATVRFQRRGARPRPASRCWPATNARTTSAALPRAPGYANEYVRHFLEQEPIPGIEFEYKIAATYLPTVTPAKCRRWRKALITDENRVVLGVAPEKKDDAAARRRHAEGVDGPRRGRHGGAVGRRHRRAAPRGEGTRAWHGGFAPRRARDWRHGAHALERRRGVAQAHGLQERPGPVHRLRAGRHVARSPGRTSRARPWRRRWSAWAGMGGFSPVDLSKMLSGKIAQASPSISEYTQGVSGSATPQDLETALQLNYLAHTAPNMTPEALDLLKRRLTRRRCKPRPESAGRVRREGRAGQHLEPLQRRGDRGRRRGRR